MTIRVRAFAKINLDLRVLHKRPDGFHELRTIFQTISLADTLVIEHERARRTEVSLDSSVDIPNNLVLRAAELVLAACRKTARVRFRLEKKIPMGGGLGGGSTDAAAVLLALPPLLGEALPVTELMTLGAELGSDVPFFLLGGTALGLGRGTELYPLPDLPRRAGLVVAPEVHVSTPEAYRALGRTLTSDAESSILNSFQALTWSVCVGDPAEAGAGFANDFEEVVFRQHPALKSLQAKLHQQGARPARLTGSGAALFGLWPSRTDAVRARGAFAGERVFPISLLGRRNYRAFWWKSLGGLVKNQLWPPRSQSGS